MDASTVSSAERAASAAEDPAEIIARILRAECPFAVLAVQEDLALGAGLSRRKVKDNFVRMARIIHPDKCSAENAQLAFSRLRAAYEQVSDDLGSPRAAFAAAPDPSAHTHSPRPEARQRRQVASLTSRMLRGAALQEGADSGPTDLSALRRYIAQPNAARQPFVVSPGGGIGRRRFSGYSESLERSDISSDGGQVDPSAMLKKGALSSATSPEDLLQQLSPQVRASPGQVQASPGQVHATFGGGAVDDMTQFQKLWREQFSVPAASVGSPASGGFIEEHSSLSGSPMSMSSPHSEVLVDRDAALMPPDLSI